MPLPRSYRFNLMVVAFLVIVAACYCRLNPAPRLVSPAEARFSRDLGSVLCELGAAREVSFEIVDAAHSPGLCLAYSMHRWPEVDQASALFRVSRYVAGQNRGVQLHDLRLQNLSNGQVWDLSESGIAVHTSSAPSAQRCFEMDLTARLQAKAQGQLDQVLGGGAALALVDCQCNGPRNLHPTSPNAPIYTPQYPTQSIRASILLARLPEPEYLEDKETKKVAAIVKAALGIDERRGDQVAVVRLPDLEPRHQMDCVGCEPSLASHWVFGARRQARLTNP